MAAKKENLQFKLQKLGMTRIKNFIVYKGVKSSFQILKALSEFKKIKVEYLRSLPRPRRK